jgi:L-amino acid N-acyltransferase YncA
VTVTFRPMEMDDLDWLHSETMAPPARDMEGLVAEIDGMRAAVVGAERWSDNACFVHLAINDSRVLAGNALLDQIADYLFDINGLKFMLSTVSSKNEASLKLQLALGFKEISRIADCFGDGEDMLILKLTREDWYSKRSH